MTRSTNKVYVGYDTREDIAYQVCKNSILKRSDNTDVFPLKQQELRDAGWYTRPVDKLASTEFTFTRYLVPQLCGFQGWALFIDCDIIALEDINKLFDQVDDKYAVMCAQHDYTPRPGIKMDGKQQTIYPRKNWSSVMLFNCAHPANKFLTTDTVNNVVYTGAFFHRFSWLDDNQIGKFSHEWNWLVGWYKQPKDGNPKMLHYTEGGPWFEDYRYCEYHKEWIKELHDVYN